MLFFTQLFDVKFAAALVLKVSSTYLLDMIPTLKNCWEWLISTLSPDVQPTPTLFVASYYHCNVEIISVKRQVFKWLTGFTRNSPSKNPENSGSLVLLLVVAMPG